MKYSEQLKSPLWQKKRLDIMNLKGFKCEECGNDKEQLHIHHRFYIKGRMAWEYDNDVYQVLCHKCHDDLHKKENNLSVFENDIIKFIRENDFCNIDFRTSIIEREFYQTLKFILKVCEYERKLPLTIPINQSTGFIPGSVVIHKTPKPKDGIPVSDYFNEDYKGDLGW